ncbi:MAG: 6-pyruvoyl tetrahydropterin synthase family protein [Planctomycetes bacterium]|nr:6-pyruvoyl tetrahydropterin synthase family protein [Planctomycetota bacterium]
MNERYEIRLRKAEHVFCAGHFITLTDDLCEPVHGHNWMVAVDVAGEPDAHGMVVDFIALRDGVTRIVSALDHRMLLPTCNRLLQVTTAAGPLGGDEVTVRFADRRWVFPAAECVLLPLANTTAEWLARWIGERLLESLNAAGEAARGTIRVAVDECLGQSGVWERPGH